MFLPFPFSSAVQTGHIAAVPDGEAVLPLGMLPSGLKIAWTTLSVTGLLSSWLSFSAFSEAVGGRWLPILYCVVNTALQGIFCLGLIWHMDTYRMPGAFCVSQAYILDGSWCALTGLNACMAMATTAIIARPCCYRSVTVIQIQQSLRWRLASLPLVLIFPAVGLIVFVAVSDRLHAIKPFDSISCDVAHPLWVRLFSYAGLPLILAVPSFLFTCVSGMRLYQSRLRSRRDPYSSPPDNLTPLPVRRQSKRPKRSSATLETTASSTLDHHSHHPDAETPIPRAGFPPGPTFVPPPVPALKLSAPSISTHAITSLPNSASAAYPIFSLGRSPSLLVDRRQYHLPFSWTPPRPRSSSESRRSAQDRPSQSPSPMTFAPPSDPPSLSNTPVPLPVFPNTAMYKTSTGSLRRQITRESDKLEFEQGHETIDEEADVEETPRSSLRFVRNSEELSITKSELQFTHEQQEHEFEEFDLVYASNSPIDHSAYPPLHQSPPAHNSSKVWRILFFQLLSSVTQILASLSSLIDIIMHRDTPTPFGTQHVALLLAAWAPCIAFGVHPWGQRPT
ncbi:hypothetical protein OBBRIDRAFT_790374 [Obba rivulosa]|uniref:Uncharacterized protein n=1 Tax=Obba rivulosa TaxID=1052685 RepID=A0A8E2DPG9_9APHY|nr:hypothetical protein OBBRIDRAFT_790374 [Obba rivulosa]